MTQLSVAARNARLSAIATLLAGGTLKFFTGTMPASNAAADAGTVLSSITLPNPAFAAPSGGAMAMTGTWDQPAAAAGGFADYYRGYDTAAACHIQGYVGQNWAASTAWALSQQCINGGNVYKCTTAGNSAGTGGPTGTGAGITDGTAVWTYVGPAEMVLDNTNIAAGQDLHITQFTLTDGNA
jgi:hypothetical protein